MRVSNEQLVHPVVFFGGGGLLAAAAALLGAVFVQGLALDIAAVAHRDHHVGWGDQIFGRQVERRVFHQAAARTDFSLTEFLFHMAQLFTDDHCHAG